MAAPLSKASPRAGALYARVRHFHGPARVPLSALSALPAQPPKPMGLSGLSRQPSSSRTESGLVRDLKELDCQ